MVPGVNFGHLTRFLDPLWGCGVLGCWVLYAGILAAKRSNCFVRERSRSEVAAKAEEFGLGKHDASIWLRPTKPRRKW